MTIACESQESGYCSWPHCIPANRVEQARNDLLMELNAAEIAIVASHWNDTLVPGVIREIFTPREPDRLILEVRTPGTNHLLQVSVAAGNCAAGALSTVPARALNAHPFAMLLRKHIGNVPIKAIGQLNSDRVMAFHFGGQAFCGSLIAELTGRNSNLHLLDEAGLLLGSFHPDRALTRKLECGLPWIPPPAAAVPAVPPRFSVKELTGTALFPALGARSVAADLEKTRSQLLAQFQSALRKTERLVENLRGDLARANAADVLREQANVLKAHLGEVAKGRARFDTVDFSGNAISIVLDPARDPVGNMQHMFDKARKLGRAVAGIENRLHAAVSHKEALDEWMRGLSAADGVDIDAARIWLSARFPLEKQRAVPVRRGETTRLPYREYPIARGLVARVGRSAKDNDQLTLRHARPWDLWLHVRGMEGSHVVVPLPRSVSHGQEELIDAAHLAAHFSSARGESMVEVSYTQRRYVQKPRGFAMGAVRLIREKTFVLKVDVQRLQRLLAGDGRHS
jgi:predicted ribosome quality control (RQC) complex YloA/Tae2 family protein